MIRGLLLDLDDTLYAESDYVVSGFRVVAERLAAASGGEAADIHRFMLRELAERGRGRVFDAAMAWCGLPTSRQVVQELVALYRAHRPAIALYADAVAALALLRADFRLAIVTDGLPAMQRNKVAALDLQNRVDVIVYSWEHSAPKPEPAAYRHALDSLALAPHEALVVGDRPDHDLAAAAALGCRAVRVRRGRFAAEASLPFACVAEIADLQALPGVLGTLRREG